MDHTAILNATASGTLGQVEDVDPSTATSLDGYLLVSGRVAMPVDGVSWALDRSEDVPIVDEEGVHLGVLCLVTGREPTHVDELTRWQYTALLADAAGPEAILGEVRFSKDYAVIDAEVFERYRQSYEGGSPLWGGFHHGSSAPDHRGYVNSLVARPGIEAPTEHHTRTFRLITRAAGPREQFLRTYHTLELLFDYVTFRRLVVAGEDLQGFGKIMSSYHRGELERLRSIIAEFCSGSEKIAEKVVRLAPYLPRATEMFQAHGKEGNPFKDQTKWEKFVALVRSGSLGAAVAKKERLVNSEDEFPGLISNIAAYHIYRIRSSIAHSRIGEFLLTDDDDEFISDFGLGLLSEVVSQVFSSEDLYALRLSGLHRPRS